MIVPAAWMPKCSMHSVVGHWTAGGYKASATDKEHYHVLVEGDGKLIRGDHEISDNVNTADDDYAAHTRRFNTGVIGIAVCCMGGDDVKERPFNGGKFPMTEKQWEVMAHATSDFVRFYTILIDKKHVLGHGEVQTNLGIIQRGKWDPMVLPWNRKLSYAQVGDLFRAKVREFAA